MKEEKVKKDPNWEMILHCQRNIQRALNESKPNLERVVYYLTKLRKVKVGLDELESTGIGRTVNSLKKSESREISEQSTLLVNKWKSAVKEQVAKEDKIDGSPERNRQMDEQIAADLKKAAKEFENRCRLNGYDLNSIKTSNNTESSNETTDNNEQHKEKAVSSSKRKIKVNVEYTGRHNKSDGSKKRKCEDEESANKSEKSHHDRKEHRKHDDHKDRHKSHKSKHDKSHDKKERDSHKSSEESKSHKHHKSSKSSSEEVEKNKKQEHRSKDKSKKDYKKEDKRSDHEIYNKVTNFDAIDTGEGVDFGAVLLGISDHTSTPSKKKVATPSKSANISKSSTSTTPPSFKIPSELSALSSSSSKLAPLDVSSIHSNNSYAPASSSTFKPSSTYTHSTSFGSTLANAKKSKNESEEDALSVVLNTKHQRTKVYSGGKSKFKQEVPLLFNLCIRILREHFDALEYTGGVPYEILKGVLEQVTPDQLYNFETYNPYLIGETDELWHRHVEKDFKTIKRQEFESWRDVYLRGVEEQEERLQSLTANLKQNNSEKPPPRRTILAYVDSYVKPPHGVVRKQMKHGVPSSSSVVKSRFAKLGPQPSENAVQSVKERFAREHAAMKERASALGAASSSKMNSIFPKKKVAPLMQKTLSMMKGTRFKR